jgi:molecular chaperone Hsp33
VQGEDLLYRFLFEESGVRGELVRLGASRRAILQCHPYPAVVADQLSQMLAASVLLSATIKPEGSLILQAQGDGPLHLVVAQATRRRTVRGLARWNAPVPHGDLAAMFGAGRLALTFETIAGEPYQGIVGLEGQSLAQAIEIYFVRSEQLATRLWLFGDEERAGGLLLQELPSRARPERDWRRLSELAEGAGTHALLSVPAAELLPGIFTTESLRLFDPEPVAFRCGCSSGRIEGMLRALGRREVDDILEEQGAVQVDCEFCNRRYRFDRVDVERLFSGEPPLPASDRVH